jgi:hypothetical protein
MTFFTYTYIKPSLIMSDDSKITVLDELLVNEPQFFLYVGRPKSGKSYAARYHIHRMLKSGYFSFGIVWCGSPDRDIDYSFMPGGFLYKDYNEADFTTYVQYLENIRTSISDDHGEWKYLDPEEKSKKQNEIMPKNFMVFDDTSLSLDVTKSRSFQYFITSYRHYETTIFFIAQHLVSQTNTRLRECASTYLIWNTENAHSVQALYYAIGASDGIDRNSKARFNEKLQRATAPDRQCLVYVKNPIGVANFFEYTSPEVHHFQLTRTTRKKIRNFKEMTLDDLKIPFRFTNIFQQLQPIKVPKIDLIPCEFCTKQIQIDQLNQHQTECGQHKIDILPSPPKTENSLFYSSASVNYKPRYQTAFAPSVFQIPSFHFPVPVHSYTPVSRVPVRSFNQPVQQKPRETYIAEVDNDPFLLKSWD